MILFILSLVAGILTVLAPCTISLLPVIVGGSVGEGQSIRRALVVTVSLGISVVLFTLILKVSTAFVHIPQSFWQIVSGVIIFLLGVTMLFPTLYEKLPWMNKLNLGGNKLLATGYNKKNMTGDILIGAALGPVFSSCSPTYFLILATVLPRSLGAGIADLLAYAVGLSGTLLIVAFAGQKLLGKFGKASNPNGWLKRGVGILFILIGIAIGFGLDKTLETAVTRAGFFDVTKIEQKLLQKELSPAVPAQTTPAQEEPLVLDTSGEASTTSSVDAVTATVKRIAIKEKTLQSAPEIAKPSAFINTGGKPINIAQYRGKKVVLIDFWTYSCINCQRTLPYLKAWYDKYETEGLVIIGIHTPEFAFEKDQKNVEGAVSRFGLKYPTVMDNDYGTWNAFNNQFWPNKFLIDIDGFVVYNHAGEGNYDVTESAIQKALAERASVIGAAPSTVSTGTVAPSGVVTVNNSKLGSPETYFGYNRNQFLANGTPGQSGTHSYALPDSPEVNSLYLGGDWNTKAEYAEGGAGSSITYRYSAKNVYFVASGGSGAKVQVMIDGKPVGSLAGKDVAADGTVTITGNRLYHLVGDSDYSTHTITITVVSGTLDAYTFTFG